MNAAKMKSARAKIVWVAACTAVLVGLLVFAAGSASAAGPVWRVVAIADTTIAPGGSGAVLIQISDSGGTPLEATDGELRLTVTLPAGLSATSIVDEDALAQKAAAGWTCAETVFPGSVVKCKKVSGAINPPADHVDFQMAISASPVLPSGSVKTIGVLAEGGGASSQATVVPVSASLEAPGFGVATIDGQVANAAGAPFTQAGGRPDSASVSFELNTLKNSAPIVGDAWPVQAPRNVFVDLPPGLVGDAQAVPQCTPAQLANAEGAESLPLCSEDSQVGTAFLRFNGGALFGYEDGPYPVFNMTPPPNAPAEFGMSVLGTLVLFDAKVRPAPDYGVTIAVVNTPEALPIAGTTVTLWGNPSLPEHDSERSCPGHIRPAATGPSCPADPASVAFLRNPTSCQPQAGSGVRDGLVTSMHVDSWENSGRLRADGFPDLSDPAWKSNSSVSHELPGYPYPSSQRGAHVLPTGCEEVPFEPQFSAAPPSDAKAGAPSSFSVELTLPQPDALGSIGESDLKSAIVKLPAGVRVSPSSANGLAACSSAQIDLSEATPPSCPAASKIGTVRVDTPLLAAPLSGSVYLAAQGDNPFGSLLAIYLVVQSHGVVLKLPGHVQADPVTGQLTTTFENQPQLPFSHLQVQFNGGSNAPLVMPAACGTYATETTLTSWSGKTVVFGPHGKTDDPGARFAVGQGAGEACGASPFAPSLNAGVSNPVAGAYSPFGLQLSRSDSDQELASLAPLTLPPGLLGRIAGVARCSDAALAQAAAKSGAAELASPSCPAGSQLGTLQTGVGAGPTPEYVSGKAYLTGPYEGAPFGLAFVVPAVAGPYDLGTVVVRAALSIDPHSAQAIVRSDPFPTILQGIPLQLRDIRVSVDRAGFMLNPTSCAPMSIAGTVNSSHGASAAVTSRFQVGECEKLAFKPKFSVSATGHPTRKSGEGLTVKIAYPQGAEANLASVRVRLPKQLPSRLTTLQKACTGRVFDANPAACPSQSRVGTATVHTPLLSGALSGPVYFVSHGVAKFPELAFVLQGEGVTVILAGETFIDEKTSITTTTFRSIPDVPVQSFALSLPQGPHSALAGHLSLCGKHLTMPTILNAQNGATIHQSTRIAVTGCRAARHPKR